MPRWLATCRECGKPVVFAVVANKAGTPPKRMPLNPEPDPDGNVAAYRDGAGTLTGRVVGKGGGHLGYERLMMPHFATCDKQAASSPAETSLKSGGETGSPGVTSLDKWRKARSADAKAKRSRRGRRPAPQITGIRWTP